MISELAESEDDLLAFTATGKLTTEDYETVFIPKLEAAIEKYGKIRALLHLDADFHGWEAGAVWDDAKFGLKHRNDFRKMAVVGGPGWMEWSVNLAAHFMQGEVKSFTQDELPAAMAWIRE